MTNVIFEGLIMSFWLLLICVVGKANGSVELVYLYEKDVQERVVDLGLITKERIKRNGTVLTIALFVPVMFLVPYMAYGINGAKSFFEGFIQMTAVYLISGLFDRLFIDFYWVGKTKAWEIEGTQDLKPYIPFKTALGKWIGTLIGFPMYAAIAAAVVSFLMK